MLQRNKSFLQSQQGAAIILALFVTSLVAAITVYLFERISIDIRQTQLIRNNDQATLYADGSIQWAVYQLQVNLQHRKARQPVDKIPLRSPVDETNGARIQTDIQDLQSRFNVNNLTNPQSLPGFIHMLQAVDPKLSKEQATVITNSIRHWISRIQSNGIDERYANQKPPFQAPHHSMASITELRLIDGMTAKRYEKLKPYLIALPDKTPININTASAPVLLTLNPNMPVDIANTIVMNRKMKPYMTTQEFLESNEIKQYPITKKMNITDVSQYFLAKTTVQIDEQIMLFNSLLKRENNKKIPKVTILWQSRGTL